MSRCIKCNQPSSYWCLDCPILKLEQQNKLYKQLILRTLDDFNLSQYDCQEDQNEITTELQLFIKEHKLMREALEQIADNEFLKPYISGDCFDIRNIATQALQQLGCGDE